MFIRKSLTRNKKTGKTYTVFRLIEAIRTPKGPRQRVILHLGDLSLNKVELKKLARILESRLLGQPSLFDTDQKLARIADEAIQNLEFRRVDEKMQTQKDESAAIQIKPDSVGMGIIRSAGPEMIGHAIWEALDFETVLKKSGFSPFDISLAKITILGRLINPGSEQQTRHWINHLSGLLELLPIEHVGKNALYEIADRLLAHKTEIERHLRNQEISLFPQPKLLFLYDLTNTYFEGQAAGNDLAKRGHSKEKRNDRPLVTLALLVDSRGFPIMSQVYRGNQSEPETLPMVLSRLENDYKDFLPELKPTIVMDKGIATAGNIDLIREKKLPYVIVERRRAEKDFGDDFKSLDGFSTFQTTSGSIQLKKIVTPGIAKVLVRSEGRVAKEEAMDGLKEKRFLEDVEKLSCSVRKGNIILPEKVGRRIGRILQRYPSMAAFYEIEAVEGQTEKKIVSISLKRRDGAVQEENIRGCYVIETSHSTMEAKEIWDFYTTLHRVEKGFRCLKTDLGFRPVYHQLGRRTEAHLFISVLAYHLLITIQTLLEAAGDSRSWATIRTVMSSLTRGNVTFADTEGRAHQIRVTGAMEPCHRDILEKLCIRNPFKRNHQIIQVRL